MNYPRMRSHSIYFIFFARDNFEIHIAIVAFFYSRIVFHYMDIAKFFIDLPVGGHLNFFQFETMTNKTAVNIHAQISI